MKGRSLSTSRSAEDAAGCAVMAGCDEWIEARRTKTNYLRGRYCEAPAPHVDEVDGRRYCLEHAGPLAWSDRDVDGVSLGVRLAGELDVQYTPPARLLDVKESAA